MLLLPSWCKTGLMSDNLLIQKKRTILKNSEKALENIYDLETKTNQEINDLVRMKDDLRRDAGIIRRQISALDRLPDSYLVNHPSTALEGLFASGVNMSESQLRSTDNLKMIFNTRDAITTYLSSGAATTATASAVTNTIMSDIVEGVAIQYPALHTIAEEIKQPTDFEKRRNLSLRLRAIAGLIADEFDGSWITLLNTANPDRFKQSAHSMREVISILLQTLAPDDDLKKTSWYKDEFSQNNQTITQKMRTKYAVLGMTPPDTLFEKSLRVVYDLLDELRDKYKLLNELAHARGEHTGSLPLVESYLKETQDTIDLILKLRMTYFPK